MRYGRRRGSSSRGGRGTGERWRWRQRRRAILISLRGSSSASTTTAAAAATSSLGTSEPRRAPSPKFPSPKPATAPNSSPSPTTSAAAHRAEPGTAQTPLECYSRGRRERRRRERWRFVPRIRRSTRHTGGRGPFRGTVVSVGKRPAPLLRCLSRFPQIFSRKGDAEVRSRTRSARPRRENGQPPPLPLPLLMLPFLSSSRCPLQTSSAPTPAALLGSFWSYRWRTYHCCPARGGGFYYQGRPLTQAPEVRPVLRRNERVAGAVAAAPSFTGPSTSAAGVVETTPVAGRARSCCRRRQLLLFAIGFLYLHHGRHDRCCYRRRRQRAHHSVSAPICTGRGRTILLGLFPQTGDRAQPEAVLRHVEPAVVVEQRLVQQDPFLRAGSSQAGRQAGGRHERGKREQRQKTRRARAGGRVGR